MGLCKTKNTWPRNSRKLRGGGFVLPHPLPLGGGGGGYEPWGPSLRPGGNLPGLGGPIVYSCLAFLCNPPPHHPFPSPLPPPGKRRDKKSGGLGGKRGRREGRVGKMRGGKDGKKREKRDMGKKRDGENRVKV